MENKYQPAFPISSEGLKMREDGQWSDCFGISKREYFAAMAMQGALASCTNADDWVTPSSVAAKSVEYADALLAELEKTETK